MAKKIGAKKSTRQIKPTSVSKARVSKKVASSPKKSTSENNFVSRFRLGESYTSLVLGIIAVIIATLLLLSFFTTRQSTRQKPDVTPTTVAQSDAFAISPTGVAIEAPEGTKAPEAKATTSTVIKGKGETYKVVAGDNLWIIAEKVYGSGYNWVDIAKVNNLSHPSDIHVGNTLKLPDVALKDATVHTPDDDQSSTTAKITGTQYKIMPNDSLWDIAVRSYGDGYQWVKIAKANNLTNPNIIHVNNTIKIPR